MSDFFARKPCAGCLPARRTLPTNSPLAEGWGSDRSKDPHGEATRRVGPVTGAAGSERLFGGSGVTHRSNRGAPDAHTIWSPSPIWDAEASWTHADHLVGRVATPSRDVPVNSQTGAVHLRPVGHHALLAEVDDAGGGPVARGLGARARRGRRRGGAGRPDRAVRRRRRRRRSPGGARRLGARRGERRPGPGRDPGELRRPGPRLRRRAVGDRRERGRRGARRGRVRRGLLRVRARVRLPGGAARRAVGAAAGLAAVEGPGRRGRARGHLVGRLPDRVARRLADHRQHRRGAVGRRPARTRRCCRPAPG